MLRFTLLSALLATASVHGSVISTSVFPNSACAGASSSLTGLVGIGRVVLSSGEVETHCGCPSDNLPSFEACPSVDGNESVCNSVLDLETGAFTASCGAIACVGAECPSTVVNTVVVDETDCFNNEKGVIGYSTVDGESKCACSADAEEFTACPTVANGRATCVATDPDFLGMAYTHKETVACGLVCEPGYFLTPGGACTKSIVKRASATGGFHSSSWIKVTPTPSSTTRSGHHTGGHHHSKSHHHTPGVFTSYFPPAPSSTGHHHGASQGHHTTTSHTGPVPTPGPSQRARRAVEEIVFADVCAQDERSCPAGDFGDFSCVRFDDVNECGGCNSTGDAKSCLDIPGVASAACLRGGCVVRACQTGYVQTDEGTCTLKA